MDSDNKPKPASDLARREFLTVAGMAGIAGVAVAARKAFPAANAAGAAADDTEAESNIVKQPSPTVTQDENTADILVDTLIAWGATHVFGIVGDGINQIVDSLRKREDKITFVTVRHEEAAAFMASAYAKHTGKIGVCLATTGPGAVHLMNGLYDAAYDNAPVVAITGSGAAPFARERQAAAA